MTCTSKSFSLTLNQLACFCCNIYGQCQEAMKIIFSHCTVSATPQICLIDQRIELWMSYLVHTDAHLMSSHWSVAKVSMFYIEHSHILGCLNTTKSLFFFACLLASGMWKFQPTHKSEQITLKLLPDKQQSRPDKRGDNCSCVHQNAYQWHLNESYLQKDFNVSDNCRNKASFVF